MFIFKLIEILKGLCVCLCVFQGQRIWEDIHQIVYRQLTLNGVRNSLSVLFSLALADGSLVHVHLTTFSHSGLSTLNQIFPVLFLPTVLVDSYGKMYFNRFKRLEQQHCFHKTIQKSFIQLTDLFEKTHHCHGDICWLITGKWIMQLSRSNSLLVLNPTKVAITHNGNGR